MFDWGAASRAQAVHDVIALTLQTGEFEVLGLLVVGLAERDVLDAAPG